MKRRTIVWIFHPESGEQRELQREKKELPFRDIEDDLANISFTHQPTSGTWHASQLQATQHADAVVAISGAEGTEITGYYAFLLGKPLLPIPVFGGSAEELWSKYKNLFRTVGFSADENRYVFSEWGKKSPSCVASALEKVASKNPFSKGTRRSWPVTLGVGAGLFVAWLGIFYFGQKGTLSRDICVFAIMLISAMMGITLRQVLRMVGPKPVNIDANFLGAEVVAGSLLAFGLLMFFYLGTIAITGVPISLNEPMDAHAVTDSFRRVAFSMTILGMAAAFLLERATKALTQRLGAVLGDHASSRGAGNVHNGTPGI